MENATRRSDDLDYFNENIKGLSVHANNSLTPIRAPYGFHVSRKSSEIPTLSSFLQTKDKKVTVSREPFVLRPRVRLAENSRERESEAVRPAGLVFDSGRRL